MKKYNELFEFKFDKLINESDKTISDLEKYKAFMIETYEKVDKSDISDYSLSHLIVCLNNLKNERLQSLRLSRFPLENI